MKIFTMDALISIKKISIVLISVSLLMLTSAIAKADALFSLQNLERERAALLLTLTSDKLSVEQRYRKADSIIRRLANYERMVLRDDRIADSNSEIVQNVFASYELSFLIHASAETKKLPVDHWLTEFNFTTDSLLNSTVGNR